MMKQGCHCRTVMASASKRQYSVATDINTFEKAFVEEKGEMLFAFFNYQTKIEDIFGTKPADNRRSPIVQASDCLLCEDPDKDGIVTGIELKDSFSDPKVPDTDGDGHNDGDEYRNGTNPRDPESPGEDG